MENKNKEKMEKEKEQKEILNFEENKKIIYSKIII